MTLEIKAAMDRVKATMSCGLSEAYQEHDPADRWRQFAQDCEALSLEFVAEHADDDEPVSQDAFDEAVRKYAITVYYKGGQAYGVHIARRIVPIKTNRQLRQLCELLGAE